MEKRFKKRKIKQMRRISGGSKQYKKNQAEKWLLVLDEQKPVKIEIKTESGEEKLLYSDRKPTKEIKQETKEIQKEEWEKNVSYIKIPTWEFSEEVQKELSEQQEDWKINKRTAIVIDVRGNGGGSSILADEFLGHFFSQEVSSFKIIKRRNKRSFALKERQLLVSPKEIGRDMPLFLLMDKNCFSTNEYFIYTLLKNKRAMGIGQKTGGGSGNPQKITIPYKESFFEVWIATWKCELENKTKLEKSGIKPTQKIGHTKSDFLNQKDKEKEFVQEYIKKNL